MRLIFAFRPFMALIVGAMASASPAYAQPANGVRYTEIPAGAYAVVAEVRAKPGKEADLREATLPLIAQVRAEPNNILYFLHEDRDLPGHFVFYEIFASKADFDAHNATPHVQAWFARLPELAEGGVKVMRMAILGRPPATGRGPPLNPGRARQ